MPYIETEYERGYRAGKADRGVLDLRTEYQKGYDAGKKAAASSGILPGGKSKFGCKAI
jgi:hypothetical protein